MTGLRTGAAAVIAACVFTSGAVAQAQPFPVKSIRLVVPLAPGGGNDTTARVVGAKLAESLGQQVVVDNRPGGAGVIASEQVLRAPADGHTLFLASTTFTTMPSMVKKLPFDTLRDFAPVTRLGVVPAAVIVHASLPVKSAKDLIALARAKPGEITFGSAGVGSGSHLGGELFKLTQGVNLLHVPYKGSALVTTALLSGEVMAGFTNPISSLPHVKAGRLRNLGIAHPERWPLLPGYPTLKEMGVPGYDMVIWNGIVVRDGTPPAIVARLHTELLKAAGHADVVNNLAADGSRPMTQTPAEFGAFLRQEVTRWLEVTKAAGLRAE